MNFLHVNADHPGSNDRNSGSQDQPLRTIQAAVLLAQPGTEIRVYPGIYRERVMPVRGGEEGRPIRLVSVVPRGAVVRGTEVLSAEPLPPGIHELKLPAEWISAHNPFAVHLKGSRIGGTCGQVFIGDRMLREVGRRDALDRSPDTWMAISEGRGILIHVDELMPPGALEVSVRDRLFAPAERGMGYWEVEGFLFERCANQSAAAFWEDNGTQRGAVGLRAGHHFRLAHNTVRHAKSIGVDVGIEGGADGHMDGVVPHDNVIEHNWVCDNGEVGVCGRLSHRTIVRKNRIERNSCLGLHTVEEGGLKFHQFFDGVVEDNLILDNDACGVWLDAVWAGARVSRNLVVNNMSAGIFMELGADGGTVDHNIVAFTRLGDGIYAHDASDMLIAHNLCFGNAHFGIYLRYVTDRPFPHQDGVERPAQCSRNRVVNNLLIDNYRGHICLPAEGPRSTENVSEHNHFLNGTQWQWEGAGFHKFCLGDNDGSLPREAVLKQLRDAGVAEPQDPMNAILTLAEWRQLGYDIHSHAPSAFRITSENGAVVKGTASLAGRDAYLQLRLTEEAASPNVPTLPGLERDYLGQHRPAMSSPGPFADLGPSTRTFDIHPNFKP